ncbi:Uncharacterized protein DAT39_010243, partial [Clarias magur]
DVELLSVPDPGSLEATTAAATGCSEVLTSEQTLKRPKSDTLPIQPKRMVALQAQREHERLSKRSPRDRRRLRTSPSPSSSSSSSSATSSPY